MATSPNVPVPSLSTQGLIYDSANKFDQLMAHVFAADANQSYLYKGRICSLTQLIEAGGSRAPDIEASLRQGFYDYFNRYYSEVGVEIVITELDNSASQLNFELKITLAEGTQQSEYNMLVRTAHKRLQEIIKLNNYGE